MWLAVCIRDHTCAKDMLSTGWKRFMLLSLKASLMLLSNGSKAEEPVARRSNAPAIIVGITAQGQANEESDISISYSKNG